MSNGLRNIRFDGAPDARQVRSRKALASALLELLEEKSFDDITIREVTARANIGYATFFRHFQSKQELLGAIAYEEIAELLALTVPFVLEEEDSRRSCRALCDYVDRHRILWQALLTGGAAGMVRDTFLAQAHDITAGLEAPPSLPVPLQLSVRYGTAATIDLLTWWLSDGRDHSAEEMAEYLDLLVIRQLTSYRA